MFDLLLDKEKGATNHDKMKQQSSTETRIASIVQTNKQTNNLQIYQ